MSNEDDATVADEEDPAAEPDTDPDPGGNANADTPVDADAEAAGAVDPDAETASEPDDEVDTDRDAEDDPAPESAIQRDDFVTVEYTARTTADGTLVDTTRESVAQEADIDLEDHDFEPRTIVVGAGHIFQQVEDDMIGKSVGDSGTVTLDAEAAFGEFDPEDVQTISADKIPEDDRYPGAHVDIDGRHGHVETIIGGRARIDFNHPLAGEEIEYEYEILDKIEDRVEQAKGFLRTVLDVELDMWIQTDEVEEAVTPDAADEEDATDAEATEEPAADVDVESEPEPEPEPESEQETEVVEYETLYIESDPMLSFNQQWMFQKQQLAQDVMDRIDVDRVVIQETIEPQPGPMGGMPGLGGLEGMEESVEDLDVDAEELVEEIDEISGDDIEE